MKLRSTASRTARLKRLTFRCVLAGCIGIPLVVISEDIKMEIRPRTDRNVQSDIQIALEFQRKLLANQDNKGLTELSQSIESSIPRPSAPSSIIVGDSPTIAPLACPPIVIGTAPSAMTSDLNQPDSEANRAPRIPSASSPFQSEARNEPSGVYVKPRVEKRLPPPTISQIQGWEPDRRMVSEAEARLAAASRQWKPVRAQIGANDAEASVRPQLSSSITIGNGSRAIDSSVIPANFQTGAEGFSAPSAPVGPGATSPSAPFNPAPNQILPNSSSPNIFPPPPVTYPPGPPGTNVPSTGLPYSPSNVPYNPSNLPTYPLRGSTIINGEPFVTTAPCQFDAYYMVEPTVSMQNPGASSCGPVASGPSYPGLPGNIIPSTVMPNQVPSGIYSPNNAGFRPLLGFGQDNFNVQLGRGIIGQPVAYVPGQPFRNFLRYLFP